MSVIGVHLHVENEEQLANRRQWVPQHRGLKREREERCVFARVNFILQTSMLILFNDIRNNSETMTSCKVCLVWNELVKIFNRSFDTTFIHFKHNFIVTKLFEERYLIMRKL